MTRPSLASFLAGLTLLAAASPAASQVPAARPTTPIRNAVEELRTAAKSATPGPRNLSRLAEVDRLEREARRAGDLGAAGQALSLGAIFAVLGEAPDRAAAYAGWAAALCRRAGDYECVGKALNTEGAIHKQRGDYVSALRVLREAAQAFNRIGDVERAGGVRFNAANIQWELGDGDGALRSFTMLEKDYPDFADASGVLASKARLLVQLGRVEDATATAEKAVAAALPRRDRRTLWTNDTATGALGALGLAHAAAGRRDLALRSFDQRLELLGPDTPPIERFLAHADYANGLVMLGDARSARKHTDAAMPLIDLTDERMRAEVLRSAAAAHAATGDPAGAYSLQRRAAEIKERLHDRSIRAASAKALADVEVAEREALLNRTRADAAEQRAKQERTLGRTRLAALVTLVALALLSAAAYVRARVVRLRREREAVMEERTRVAGEVHDTLMAGFASVTRQIDLAVERLGDAAPDAQESLRTAANVARRTLGEARDAVWNLRAPIDGPALAVELRALAAEGFVEDGVSLEVTTSGDMERVPAVAASALERVAREAVGNAVLHGRAKQVKLTLQVKPESVELSIRDDGQGFDDAKTPANTGRWGLVGMRERMHRLGGRFLFESRPGAGTLVTAEAPI